MKTSTGSWQNRSLALGSSSWGFQVRGRVNYGKDPESAGDGRFEGGVSRGGRASKSPRTSGLLESTGLRIYFQETRFRQTESQEDGEDNPPRCLQVQMDLFTTTISACLSISRAIFEPMRNMMTLKTIVHPLSLIEFQLCIS